MSRPLPYSIVWIDTTLKMLGFCHSGSLLAGIHQGRNSFHFG